jgi:hypothetical protein
VGFFTGMIVSLVLLSVFGYICTLAVVFISVGFGGRPSGTNFKLVHRFFFKFHKVLVIEEKVHDNTPSYRIARKNWIFPSVVATDVNDYYLSSAHVAVNYAKKLYDDELKTFTEKFSKRVNVIHTVNR